MDGLAEVSPCEEPSSPDRADIELADATERTEAEGLATREDDLNDELNGARKPLDVLDAPERAGEDAPDAMRRPRLGLRALLIG